VAAPATGARVAVATVARATVRGLLKDATVTFISKSFYVKLG